jgi:cyclophilin family peptidyl-prolyl cis-trans isomerase
VANFLSLIDGGRGVGDDGVPYRYKGTKIHRYGDFNFSIVFNMCVCLHRCVTDLSFVGGDLLGEGGPCSKSIYGGGYFKDENFILRHTGAGVLSMSNLGPDTNGSIFQVMFRENRDMDERYVVFGALCTEESFEVLHKINSFGTEWGIPKEELTISECGVAYPFN